MGIRWMALACLAAAAAWAAEDRPAKPEVRIGKARGEIRVDGKLDEDAWRSAAKVSLRAADGKKDASRATEVRLAYDERSLYVSFACDDPDVWTAHRGRDSHMWTEDVVEVFIDLDPKDPAYVELEVNPLGDLFDGLFFQRHKDVLMSWNPDIKIGVSVDGTANERGDVDRRWTVEMAIPIGDLSPSGGVGRPGADLKPGSSIGINFYRNERSGEKGELQSWSPVQGDFHATEHFGRAVFVE